MAVELYPERNCATCTAAKKKEWGCNGNAVMPLSFNGVPDYTCIRRPILDNSTWFNEIFTMYKMFKAGFLPNDGSYLAQPIGFIKVINIIDATLDECSQIKEANERDKKKRRAMKDTLRGK